MRRAAIQASPSSSSIPIARGPSRMTGGPCLAPVDNRFHVRAPSGERRPLLVRPCMPLIDADDAGAASRIEISGRFGELRLEREAERAPPPESWPQPG
jgi:hypothetical protein